ncbi:hypothetical protein RM545_12580 [Zunongwangia sp. F260]|uniref:Outer membrane protein beta-barrel domain-containing protein n=1 Tax=Autumnicola lenta TaxID=3075593 RepID=A0ABU3CME9_9FLAO|nr:hypothetical protein [Zunongwangia sp. F260]MDT0647527.1 hypothetical protein [Zunongwangia sp. F260]
MRILLVLISVILFSSCYSQDTIKKTNPVLFGEIILGYGGSFGEFGGFAYGGSGNIQYEKHFFTIRHIENPQFQYGAVAIGLIGIPIVKSKFKNTELALLYGRRYVKNGRSLSFSGGISKNEFEAKFRDENDQSLKVVADHYGFAYELNVKWFKAKKKPYRIYAIIPVTKPTSFGRSFGFKLTGNISEHSYLGVAMTYGFGWHKEY